jgi:hypothetical protein
VSARLRCTLCRPRANCLNSSVESCFSAPTTADARSIRSHADDSCSYLP